MQRKSLRRTGLYSVLLGMKGLASVNSSFYWRKWTFYLIERKKLTQPHSFKWWLAFSHTWKTVFFLFFTSALENSKSVLEMHRRVINLNASWALWAWLKEVPQKLPLCPFSKHPEAAWVSKGQSFQFAGALATETKQKIQFGKRNRHSKHLPSGEKLVQRCCWAGHRCRLCVCPFFFSFFLK